MTEQTPNEPIEFEQLVDDYVYGKLVEWRVYEGHVAQNTMRGELADEIASFAAYHLEDALRVRPTLDRDAIVALEKRDAHWRGTDFVEGWNFALDAVLALINDEL